MISAPIWFLLFLVLVAGLIWLAMTFVRRRKRGAVVGPVCGACGYSVLGLAAPKCPECGGDLRAVGILTPSTPPPGPGLFAAILLFTMLLGFVAMIVTPTLVGVMPVERSYARTIRLITPGSGAYKEVVVRTECRLWGRRPMSPPVEIEVLPAGGATRPAAPPRLTLRPDGTYQSTALAVASTRPGDFGTAAVLRWLGASGIDVTRKGVREEAARIVSEARRAARAPERVAGGHIGGYSSTGSGGDPDGQFATLVTTERGNRRPPPWALPPVVLFWLAGFVFGIRHLARRGTPAREAAPDAA